MATHVISPQAGNLTFGATVPGGAALNPGDVVEFQAGTYSGVIKFDGANGASGNPITIVNTGGVVTLDGRAVNANTWNLLIENSNWLEFNFDNVAGVDYGLDSDSRIKMHSGTNIKLSFIEVHNNAGIGIHVVQQDANKSVEITDVDIFDCFPHDCDGEATYIGNTRTSSPIATDYVLRRVRQRRLVVSDCLEGVGINSCYDWEITDCTITDTTPGGISAHNAGLSIGKGASGGFAARNTIIRSDGYGIAINVSDNMELSTDEILIYENIVHDCGYGGAGREHGIFVSSAIPTVKIYNNTVTKVITHAIRLADNDAFAYDNIALVDGGSGNGISLAASVSAANAHHNLSSTQAESHDNIAHTTTSLKFTNYANDDFHIESDSPAVGISSTGNDIGRYQLADSSPGGGTPVQLNHQVTGSTDDGRQLAAGGMNLIDTGHTINDPDEYLGYRFNNVAIPQGATITQADFAIDVGNTTNDDPNLIIYGEDIDNAPTFTTNSGDMSGRSQTTANVAWVATGIGTGFVTAPSIITIIQEIVNRAGWSSGNSIVLLLKDTGGALRSNTVDKGSASGAVLTTTHTSGTANAASIVIQAVSRLNTSSRVSKSAVISQSAIPQLSISPTIATPSAIVFRDLPLLTDPPKNSNVSMLSISTMAIEVSTREFRSVQIASNSELLLAYKTVANRGIALRSIFTLSQTVSNVASDQNRSIAFRNISQFKPNGRIVDQGDASVRIQAVTVLHSSYTVTVGRSVTYQSITQLSTRPNQRISKLIALSSMPELRSTSTISNPQTVNSNIVFQTFGLISAILSISTKATRNFIAGRRNKIFTSKTRR